MENAYQSLSHSKWDCKYHVVFVPKYRRKALYGEIRRQLGPILHELAKQKECQIIEGYLMSDHVNMCLAIPPKHAVSSVIGFMKGKSVIAIARLPGKERTLPEKASGHAVMPSRPSGSMKNRCAITFVTRQVRMAVDASETNRGRRPLGCQ